MKTLINYPDNFEEIKLAVLEGRQPPAPVFAPESPMTVAMKRTKEYFREGEDKIDSLTKEIAELKSRNETPDHEMAIGKKVLAAGLKQGKKLQDEKERKKKICYKYYDSMIKETHWFKGESKIKKEIAKKMHLSEKTINRYLQERTD